MSSSKLFYKIGEVCEQLGVEPHVLRYWETEFTHLSPRKNKAGQRIYSAKDLELLHNIRHLLYERRYTIAGARKILSGRAAEMTETEQLAAAKAALLDLRAQLRALHAQITAPLKQK